MIVKFKIFEEWSPPIVLLMIDKDLIIYKNFLNEITFKLKNREYSMTTGVAKILGTKYENNEELRNIKIIEKPYGRTLNNNATLKSLAKIFLKYFGYDDSYIERNYVVFSHRLSILNVVKSSNTIGEFIDNMKEYIHELNIENNMKKYNL